MAKPMSLMCLIAIGLLLSFADVSGETLKSTPGVGHTTDDPRNGSEEKGEDNVGNGALKETPETLMAQLGNLKDKLDALRVGVGIFVQGYELYDHTSANYKRFKKGEMSQEEFESEVRKEVGGVVRSLCSTGGKTAGKGVGYLLFSHTGEVVGGYVGEELGNIFGTLLTGGTGDDVAKAMVLGNGDAGISALRIFMKVLGDLERALDVVLKVYPHVSASYERWQNGEISLREVGRDVVRVGSPMAGTVAGATLGAWYLGPALGQLAIPIPGLGAFVGGYVGGKVGAMFGELV
ncbi:uncharacterized protein LOC144913804 [Branchiostoma floridae x Branchiostoma belcheri]